MRLEDYDHGERHTAKVIANRLITPAGGEEVHELTLDVPGTMRCEAGQSIGVIIGAPVERGAAQAHKITLRHPHHFRLYTVASTPESTAADQTIITLCVQRCDYVDDYSGEAHPGIASNYLCDLEPGAALSVNGPFGRPWVLPADRAADLLLIAMGTGIAPFRALVRQLYEGEEAWTGQVWLLNMAARGTHLLYMNDHADEFAQYDDRESFRVLKAVSPRPHWDDPIALRDVLEVEADHLSSILGSEHGAVFIAGREAIIPVLDDVIGAHLETPDGWPAKKAELESADRWQALVY